MVPVRIAFTPSRSPISRAICRRDRCALRLAQILDALHQVLLAHNVDDRRLLQIDLQCLVQRGVKNRVAGMVDEVGQDDRILGCPGPGSA